MDATFDQKVASDDDAVEGIIGPWIPPVALFLSAIWVMKLLGGGCTSNRFTWLCLTNRL